MRGADTKQRDEATVSLTNGGIARALKRYINYKQVINKTFLIGVINNS
jgi:hypothetical protein